MVARPQPHPFALEAVERFMPTRLLQRREKPTTTMSLMATPYVDPDDPELRTERMRWRQRVVRARREGGFTIRQAEDIAAELGKHPTEIWSNYYEVVDGLEERRSA